MNRLDCIPCLLAHALKTIRKSGVPEDVEQELFALAFDEARVLLDAAPAPIAASAIYRALAEKTGVEDPFRNFKIKSTEMALKILPRLRDIVWQSDKPFHKAVEFAIAGNAIDLVQMDEHELDDVVAWLESHDIDLSNDETISALKNEIRGADTIFIIGDNAGETVFDVLLLELIDGPKVYYGVRGGPALNDVTEREAEESGIAEVAEIVSSESDIPGTMLEHVGDDFRKLFDRADVVIAKGQGNLETLDKAPRPVYHLFKAKCEPIAKLAGRKVGDFVVWKNSPNQEV